MPPAHPVLGRGACSIYRLDAAAVSGLTLSPDYEPCEFDSNQYAVDRRVDRVLPSHAWRVEDARNADVVLISDHEFSRWCVAIHTVLAAGGLYNSVHKDQVPLCAGGTAAEQHASPSATTRRLVSRHERFKNVIWTKVHAAVDRLELEVNRSLPVAMVLTCNMCGPPWSKPRPAAQRRVIHLRDFVPAKLARSEPEWYSVLPYLSPGLNRLALASAATPWAGRKLLFFAGHIPKLRFSPTRYLLWRELARRPLDATVLASDVLCTVGAYESCRAPEPRSLGAATAFCSRCSTTSGNCTTPELLRHHCHNNRDVNFSEDVPLMRQTQRKLSPAEYRRMAMEHRFCLIAPGDFLTSPKLPETIAIAAVGGCLPVLVLTSPVRHAAASQLPFASSWLDYCELAHLVPELAIKADAPAAVAGLIRVLASVNAQEASAKRRAIKLVRDAFVYKDAGRADDGSRRATAEDFVLHEVCDKARKWRAGHRAQRVSSRPIGDCLAVPEPTDSSTLKRFGVQRLTSVPA